MNYLYAENISKSYSDKSLFKGITLSINKGERIAFVAKNGAGKSSLINIIKGKEQPDSGTVQLRKNLKIGLLEQEPMVDEEKTIIETVFDGDNDVAKTVRFYEQCILSKADSREVEAATEQMDRLQAWNFESQAKQILSKLKLGDINRKTKTLSGGQRKRLALARILIADPDFLILDEPTNHLDIEMIEWLESYLQKNFDTILLVSHDRDFLDQVCNKIVELEDERLYFYSGNYEYYLEKKTERQEIESAEVDRARNLLRKELDWIRRQPKARTTKSKSRIDAFYDLKEKTSGTERESKMSTAIKTSRLGGKVVEFHHVYKSLGDQKILSGFSYKFRTGEKVGIIGNNGSGKTTFLNLITGQTNPDAGKIVVGETVQMGYYRQEGIIINETKRVIEVIRDIADYITLDRGKTLTAAALLERFLFDRNKQNDFVERLSGGEKRRLYLLTVLMVNPNFLILDEPTNDLDITTLQVLEEFLEDYPGCLVVVSHDRRFMRKITDHLLIFEGGGKVVDFPGNYSDYLSWKEELAEEIKQKQQHDEPVSPAIKAPRSKVRLSYNERQEFLKLEEEIDELEKRKSQLSEMIQSNLPFDKMQQISIELNNIIQLLDKKSNRWLELSEYAQ